MNESDPRLRFVFRTTLALGAAFAVVGAFVFSMRAGISVAAGALVAAGNLWVLMRVVGAVFPKDGAVKRGARAWGLVAAVKILVLFGGLWALVATGFVAPLPMLAGFGALPIAIAISAFVSDTDSSKDPDA